MTEILTESFCERCGTRYTFEPVQSKRRGLGKIGTLGRGFRHFVSDPGSSLDEAFAVAKSEQEQQSTTHALEAFHRTFNFCLNCRQYTCGDCWNAVEGRCLSCAPTGESLEPPATRMDTAIVLPPVDETPARVRIDIGDEPDLRNAGPWIGGSPDGEPEKPAVEAWPEEPSPLDALPPLETLPSREPRPALESLTETAPEPGLELEPLPDLASAEAIDARLAVPPTDDAITGILDEPLAAVLDQAAAADVEPVQATPTEEPPTEAVAPTVALVEQVETRAEPIKLEADAPMEAAAEAIEAEAPVEASGEPVSEPVAEPVAEAAPTADAQPAGDASGTARADLAFEPGLNLDEQIAEYERRIAAERAGPAAGEPRQVAEPESVEAPPEPVAATKVEPEPIAAVEPEPELIAAVEPEPEPVAAAAVEPEPVTAAVEPEPVTAPVEPEPVAASEQAPATEQAPAAPAPTEELPVAASAPTPATPSEPIPTAIGTPLPASVVDGPLAWPNSDLAAAAFEQQWPDIPVPRQPPAATPPQQAPQPEIAKQAQPPSPPAAPLRTTGAHLPSVTAPPPVLAARACPSCGLSLSASARFCRRCGTAQQVDAAR